MTWYRLFDSDKTVVSGEDYASYFLPHWFHDSISEAVQADLMSRGLHDFTLVDADYLLDDTPLTFDLPGMVMTLREYIVVDLKEIKIQVPCTDVDHILHEAQTARTRDGDYVKLHGFLKCLCLTKAQRTEFITQLSEKLDYARAIAHTENQVFNDAMARLPQAVVVDRPTEAPRALREAKEEGRDVKLLIKRRPVKKGVAEG